MTPDAAPWTNLPTGRHQRRFGSEALGFTAWIWRGSPGPTLVVNGATHGDEYEGPTLLRRWADGWKPAELKGTVVVIPVLNETAFAAKTRCSPADGQDLARVFPGDGKGSPTQQLAALFDQEVLAHATHYIDLHSGGHTLELLPWVGFMTGGDPSLTQTQHAMAACFDDFWCWSAPFLPGRTLSAAFTRGVAAIYTEGRGTGDVRVADLLGWERGLQNLLIEIGCLPGPAPDRSRQIHYESVEAEDAHLQIHHPAPHAGVFEPMIQVGAGVSIGQELGLVWPMPAGTPSPILAEKTGTVVARRHPRSVQAGDPLFVIVPI